MFPPLFNSDPPLNLSRTNPYANQGSSLSNHGNDLPAGAFQLKWVQGTTVKKCYGCGGDIQNPSVQRLDDLVVVCRDFRQYRDRMTGQLTRSTTTQNVHFHLRWQCILTQYPRFHSGLLVISPAFQALLHQEHRHRLSVNFGWKTNALRKQTKITAIDVVYRIFKKHCYVLVLFCFIV